MQVKKMYRRTYLTLMSGKLLSNFYSFSFLSYQNLPLYQVSKPVVEKLELMEPIGKG